MLMLADVSCSILAVHSVFCVYFIMCFGHLRSYSKAHTDACLLPLVTSALRCQTYL